MRNADRGMRNRTKPLMRNFAYISQSAIRIPHFITILRFTILPAVIYLRQIRMRRCLLVFLWALPLLLAGCKKGESNLTQSTPSPTASAPTSPTPVVQATPTPPPDTNRTAKFIVLLYHRFEDRPAELVTTQNDFRAQMKALKDNGISVVSRKDL